MTQDTRDADADVAVIGLGPVGQALAILLAQRGHRVIAVEKHRVPYPLPRAIHLTPDVSRLLDECGVSDYLDDFSSPTRAYEWQNAERRTLLRFEFPEMSEQGWAGSTMFNQPGLEERLRRRGSELETLEVHRGATLTDLVQDDDGVRLTFTEPDGTIATRRVRYLVGCDGANSFVRTRMDVETEDLGFFYRWLVVDLIPRDDRPWEPENLQVCDPRRPITSVGGGPGRRRFEFMEMPGDDPEAFDSDETAWRLLAEQGIGPRDVELERRVLYTFQARWAKSWRDGRLFLAGDAAHQVPPFYGEGMVAGVRDSINLAWKLDLVLRGTADPALLDTYTAERGAHVQHVIWMSVELGKVICQTDPAAVSARDDHFLTHGPDPARALPEAPPERLGRGAFASGDPSDTAAEGVLAVNGRVGFPDGGVDLLDRRTWGSFVLLLDGEAVDDSVAAEAVTEAPAGLDLIAVRVVPAGVRPEGWAVTDEDARYLPWLRAGGDVARLVRPDHYTFGSAASVAAVAGLVAALRPAVVEAAGPRVAVRHAVAE